MGLKGKVEIWDDTDEVDIPGATLALATSIYSRINNYCATTADRNTLAATMTSAEKLGARFWVDDRKGFCFWDGTRWRWEPQRNQLIDAYRPSAADVNTTTGGLVLAGGTFTLPPGNRLVEVTAGALIDNLNASPVAAGRAFVTGTNTGIPAGLNYMQATVSGDTAEHSVAKTWYVVLSGTCTFNVNGLSVYNAIQIRFTHTSIQVFDLGPSDD